MIEAIGVIPARYGSTRFPGKVLASLWGKPVIQHVYERVAKCRALRQVIVATDDERVRKAVEAFGGTARMTSPDHRSGTDRVGEVAKELHADLFVNIQGDEPMVEPEDISRLVAAFEEDPRLPMATLRTPLSDPTRLQDPNLVKVVSDARDTVLLFSRSPIPFQRDPNRRAGAMPEEVGVRVSTEPVHFVHVGIYAYRRNALLAICRKSPGKLERIEDLEQLRPLEMGYRIRTLLASGQPMGIDTPEDLERLESKKGGTMNSKAILP